MNILNILYNFQQGGVERLAIDVANQLAKTDNNSHICIISENYSEELLSNLSNKVIQHRLVKADKNRKLNYIKQIIKIIDKNKIKVIHVHQGVLMNFFLILKVLRPSVRFYYTVHDTYIFSELSGKNRMISKFICKKIIAISDAVVDDIKKFGIKESKIKRVYNGVNFEKFPIFDRSKGETIKIVNVARFFPDKKGQDLLIKAAPLLKEKGCSFHITFAGGEVREAPDAISKMRDLAKSLNVEDNITFLGNVDNVPDLLKNSDIFCIPSRYEGFGISAVEAMSTGMPCVASNVIGLNEVVNADILGKLFNYNDEEDLARQLEYVINNYDRYNPQVISDNVRKRFSIESMCENLIKIYS